MASRSWNRVELIGNLTRDPELRFTPSGAAVASFGVATNRSYVTEGERKEEVDFHRIVAWNKLAELCNQLLKKGSRVFVSGRLQYRDWETQEGQKRRDAEIVLEDMILITPKGGGSGEDFSEDISESVSERTSSKSSSPSAAKQSAPTDDTSTQPADDTKQPTTEETKENTPSESVADDDLPF
ncbi:single-stranded DNA-binding protein [Patescibacteria group bacterium]|nr:single-stranded DNA-binding protein [Patescibacteria group bacterium]MCL5409719.1 single-stranded DNA-binding protein [Patescibacteria group bacterium]